MAIRGSNSRRESAEIRWIHGKDNSADAMTNHKLTLTPQRLFREK